MRIHLKFLQPRALHSFSISLRLSHSFSLSYTDISLLVFSVFDLNNLFLHVLMETQSLKQRIRDESTKTTTNDNNNRKAKRTVMAKRGLRSLTIAVAFPVSLTLITIYCSAGDGHVARTPFFWALHLASLASSFLMGLSAWLVWAEGGFHRQPTALYLYLAQLILGLCWAPITFTYRATKFGLIVCVCLFGALVGCSQNYRKLNPIAADLVKPCLAWVAFMTIVNFKLLYA